MKGINSMKQFIKFLQHPLLKILASPLAYIGFGLITGVAMTSQIQWLNIVLLYLIVASAHLIDHFFFLKYSQKRSNATPMFLLIFCEAIMIISSVVFFMQQHLIISLLLLMYLIFIHLQWFPYKMTGTFYHYLLNVFFHAFILNVIAFYTQTNGITPSILIALIPVVLFVAGNQLEITRLKQLIVGAKISFWLKASTIFSVIFSFIALGVAFYLALPSSTFYIVQIILVFITTVSILPTLVATKQSQQAQNKINYYSSISLIFSILYGLSYIF